MSDNRNLDGAATARNSTENPMSDREKLAQEVLDQHRREYVGSNILGCMVHPDIAIRAMLAFSDAERLSGLGEASEDEEPAAWAIAAERAATEAYAEHMGDPDGNDDTHAARTAAAFAIERHALASFAEHERG